MFARAFLIIGAVFSFAAAAEAGVITSLDGRASVSSGEGFRLAANGTELQPGDRLLVGKDSRVTVAFAADCQIALKEGQILTVSNQSPCSQSHVRHLDVTSQLNNLGRPVELEYTQGQLLALGLAGAGIAGGIAVLIALRSGDDDKVVTKNVAPASP